MYKALEVILAIKKVQSILSYCIILVNILIIKTKGVYSFK